MVQVSEQLIDDHAAVGKVLKELQRALLSGDVKTAYTKLDLFWARLAVHIRAEHLHLFPTVLDSFQAPSRDEAQSVVAELRRDHDFFMHELVRAVEIMRGLSPVLSDVKNIVDKVEQRLVTHNEVEENKIYRWATTLLSPEEQEKLANQITTELRKQPSRFTLTMWRDDD